MLEVIDLHRGAVSEIPDDEEFAYLKEEAASVWDRAAELGKRHGYRNAQVTVLAPTGTISFLMDCDTTGIEPDIALVKYKLLAGGGMLKIVNQTVKPALEKLGYNSEEIEHIIAHIDRFDTIEDRPARSQTARPIGRPAIRSRSISRFLIAPSSRTKANAVSLHGASADDGGGAAVPERRDFENGEHAGNATVDDIMNTYVEGWRLGLKAIAIYRDGSKRSAPLEHAERRRTWAAFDGAMRCHRRSPEELQKRILELEEEIAMLREPARSANRVIGCRTRACR